MSGEKASYCRHEHDGHEREHAYLRVFIRTYVNLMKPEPWTNYSMLINDLTLTFAWKVYNTIHICLTSNRYTVHGDTHHRSNTETTQRHAQGTHL